MFNVKVLDEAIKNLPDEGKKEIAKMVQVLEGFQSEVDRLSEIADGFEQLSKNLQKENEELKAKLAVEKMPEILPKDNQ